MENRWSKETIEGARGQLEEKGGNGRSKETITYRIKKTIGGARGQLKEQGDNRRSKETMGEGRRCMETIEEAWRQ